MTMFARCLICRVCAKIALLAPIAAVVFWMGVYPESFLAPMRGDVGTLEARVARAAPKGRFAADYRQRRLLLPAGHAEVKSMNASLLMTLPELVLAVGAIALMVVAAWGGQASTRAISWASVAVLIGAGIALTGPASSGGAAFGGLYRADAFAAFAKVLIYGASAVAIIIAPRFFAGR